MWVFFFYNFVQHFSDKNVNIYQEILYIDYRTCIRLDNCSTIGGCASYTCVISQVTNEQVFSNLLKVLYRM